MPSELKWGHPSAGRREENGRPPSSSSSAIRTSEYGIGSSLASFRGRANCGMGDDELPRSADDGECNLEEENG
eukprot:CAMPEP_0172546816 /NCGR_PEP_ID=MMETSP1067-20121228/16505_1 /TAXON_ID=265564 ORGANISM="Thalassiosira punctigera, Strain Tpunct2005C2" /NCGR_SAMPLE_ID=MMETSP1067 /ASSEMBLY_ACC=CAM_ASM_000444 /LENGTH=72 /DNA_ID=CAMNT_0013333799 /DNA_START=31 /DNA_END=246 /DNA_ORIENTATION=-